MRIAKSKERIKSTNEVYTALELVDDALGQIPPEWWAESSEKKVLENSVGEGNIVVRLIAWKIHFGKSSAERALKTTYGSELEPDTAAVARRRMLIHAYEAEKNPDVLLKVLSYANEDRIATEPQFKQFERSHKHIVESNIADGDSLQHMVPGLYPWKTWD